MNYNYLPFILLGDINHDLLSLKKNNDSMITLLSSYGFRVLNTAPTRLTEKIKTCIDWIISNPLAEDLIINILTKSVPFSDHELLLFSYKNLEIKNFL